LTPCSIGRAKGKASTPDGNGDSKVPIKSAADPRPVGQLQEICWVAHQAAREARATGVIHPQFKIGHSKFEYG